MVIVVAFLPPPDADACTHVAHEQADDMVPKAAVRDPVVAGVVPDKSCLLKIEPKKQCAYHAKGSAVAKQAKGEGQRGGENSKASEAFKQEICVIGLVQPFRKNVLGEFVPVLLERVIVTLADVFFGNVSNVEKVQPLPRFQGMELHKGICHIFSSTVKERTNSTRVAGCKSFDVVHFSSNHNENSRWIFNGGSHFVHSHSRNCFLFTAREQNSIHQNLLCHTFIFDPHEGLVISPESTFAH
mmetsp:Transcript_30147/g.59020  ORF Transcript_30147/g.59020 Transcript_30147/m.59020 type:complete len:242 (+) Transcript_30147:831-1556(+)